MQRLDPHLREVKQDDIAVGTCALVFDDEDVDLPWALVRKVSSIGQDWIFLVEWEGEVAETFDVLTAYSGLSSYRFFPCDPDPVIMAAAHLDAASWYAWCYRYVGIPIPEEQP